MNFRVPALLVCLTACSSGTSQEGATPPASEPAPEAPAVEDPSVSYSNSAVSRSDSDTAAVLQAVVDLPALEPFLHAELPERRPLRLLATGVVEDRPALERFGEPVAWTDTDGGPTLELTRVEVGDAEAEVTFRYPIEGVAGSVSLQKQAGTWVVVDHEVVEQ